MLADTLTLVDGSSVLNLVLPTGTADPSSPDTGELFFRTDLGALRVYNSSAWVSVGNAGLFTSSVAGLVPGSGGGTTNFLRADGTWATPTAAFNGGTVTSAITISAALPQLILGNTTNAARITSVVNTAGAGQTLQLLGANATTSGQNGGSAAMIGGAGNGTATGGDVTLTGGNSGTSGGTGGAITIVAGLAAGGTAAGGAVTIAGGNGSTSGAGGSIILNAGQSTSGNGGHVWLEAGDSTSGTKGSIVLRAASIERLRVLPSGAWSIGPDGNNYGTSGYVLTSNGNAAPTWQAAAGGGGSLTATYIGYGNGSNQLTGEADLTWNATTNLMTVGSLATGGIVAGSDNASGTGGSLTVRGGDSTSGGVGNHIFIRGGNGTAGTGGHVNITGGTSSNQPGNIVLTTSKASGNTSTGSMYIDMAQSSAGNSRVVLRGSSQGYEALQIVTSTQSGGIADYNQGGSVGGTGYTSMLIQSGTQHGGAGPLTLELAGYDSLGSMAGGNVQIRGGVNQNGGSGFAGNVLIQGGKPLTIATNGGYVSVSTVPAGTVTLTERLRILTTGAWSVGSNGTSYGTSGYVLTSQGNAPPQWLPAAGGSATLNSTQIGYGNGSNVLTGESTFTWTTGTQLLAIGTGTVGPKIQAAASSSGQGTAFTITGSAGASTNNNGGAVTITGGNAAGNGAGGLVTITGGPNSGSSGSIGGGVDITGRIGGASGAGGPINIIAGPGGASAVGGALILSAGSGGSNANGAVTTLRGGPGGVTSGNGGALNVSGGDVTQGNSSVGGDIVIQGGNTAGAGSTAVSGTVTIQSGAAVGSAGKAGAIFISNIPAQYNTPTAAFDANGFDPAIYGRFNSAQWPTKASVVISGTGANTTNTLTNGLGNVVVQGGNPFSNAAGTNTGGGTYILGGSGAQITGSGVAHGGLVSVAGGHGVGTNANGGNVTITAGSRTGSGTAGVINLVIPATGALQINGSAGTATHVLTSNGAGAAPTWQAAGAAGVSSITGTANQITASASTGAVTLSIPTTLNIGTGSVGPTFAAVTSTSGAGTAFAINGSTAQSGAGGTLSIRSGNATGTGVGGTMSITTGTSANAAGGVLNLTSGAGTGANGGGQLNITGGAAPGAGTGGSVIISGGTSSSGTAGAVRILTNSTERLDIRADGAWEVAGDVGTATYVLTSNGAGTSPTWQAVAGGGGFNGGTITTAITIDADGPQSILGNTSNPAWIRSTNNGAGAGQRLSLTGANSAAPGQVGGEVMITGGAGGSGAIGGAASMQGGNTAAASTYDSIWIQGAVNTGSGPGGSIAINSGSSTTGGGGDIYLTTGGASYAQNERLRIVASGAWSVGANGTDFGTGGFQLTTNGSGGPPTWQAAASDSRLKTNVAAIPVGLDYINGLTPVEYNWVGDRHDGKLHYGLIAQDVPVAGGIVCEGPVYLGGELIEDAKQLQYNEITAVLIKAVQELSEKLDAKDTEIADLLARVAALEA